ncbi:hypothetical protein BGW80DRAFT_1379660, partial [Lactifluus volemus]
MLRTPGHHINPWQCMLCGRGLSRTTDQAGQSHSCLRGNLVLHSCRTGTHIPSNY